MAGIVSTARSSSRRSTPRPAPRPASTSCCAATNREAHRMFIEKLLQLMAEKKASDIFISAGSPISIKIQGTIMPVNPQVMDAETTKKIILEMLTPKQQETFVTEQELNFSKPMAGLGNFRVNCFWQKGTCSMVIRFVTAEIPKMQEL